MMYYSEEILHSFLKVEEFSTIEKNFCNSELANSIDFYHIQVYLKKKYVQQLTGHCKVSHIYQVFRVLYFKDVLIYFLNIFHKGFPCDTN